MCFRSCSHGDARFATSTSRPGGGRPGPDGAALLDPPRAPSIHRDGDTASAMRVPSTRVSRHSSVAIAFSASAPDAARVTCEASVIFRRARSRSSAQTAPGQLSVSGLGRTGGGLRGRSVHEQQKPPGHPLPAHTLAADHFRDSLTAADREALASAAAHEDAWERRILDASRGACPRAHRCGTRHGTAGVCQGVSGDVGAGRETGNRPPDRRRVRAQAVGRVPRGPGSFDFDGRPDAQREGSGDRSSARSPRWC